MTNETSACIFLFDFGHPMTKDTINAIETSLNNVMSLMSVYSTNSTVNILGFTIMNLDFTLVSPARLIFKHLDAIKKAFKEVYLKNLDKHKVTVAQYKTLVRSSLQRILNCLKTFSQLIIQSKENLMNEMQENFNKKIQIFIISKKTALLMCDIMKDVINKLIQEEHGHILSLVNKFQIIQISDESNSDMNRSNSFFSFNSCPDNIQGFNFLFKNLIFNSECNMEYLRITLSKDFNVFVECDTQDFAIDPALLRFEKNSDLCNDFMFRVSTKNSLLGLLKNIENLEVLFRVPLSEMQSILTTGLTRRVFASNSFSLNSSKQEVNRKIFHALCKKLEESNEGLLAFCKFSSEAHDLLAYYYLIPEGDALLLNCVLPEELYLTKYPVSLVNNFDDENATSIIETSFQGIKVLEKYSPAKFSSGLYENLKNKLFKNCETKQELLLAKKKTTFFKRSRRYLKKERVEVRNPENHSKEDASDYEGLSKTSTQEICKISRFKNAKRTENEKTHPALLSPNTLKKLRNPDFDKFQLPELTPAYND